MFPDQKEYEFTLSNDELSLLRKISSNHEGLARLFSAAVTTRDGKLRLRMGSTYSRGTERCPDRTVGAEGFC